jgi:Type II CAAX prenyl endopeptidase Rce1-like
MFPETGEYWAATRHPWSCALFVLPLLAIYELGLYSLGAATADSWRNGADVWLRTGMASIGISPVFGLPVALVLLFLAWTFLYREARPRDTLGVWIGMASESVIFATLLYGIGQGSWSLLRAFSGMLEGQGLPALTQTSEAWPIHIEPALANIVRYLGAGIYEETVFRLLFFSGLLAIFSLIELPRRWGILVATLASALLFAGAHNIGPRGEAFQSTLFLFRGMAGVYFSWLYCVRGIGVAVGTHAGYDLLVGLFVPGQAAG